MSVLAIYVVVGYTTGNAGEAALASVSMQSSTTLFNLAHPFFSSLVEELTNMIECASSIGLHSSVAVNSHYKTSAAGCLIPA